MKNNRSIFLLFIFLISGNLSLFAQITDTISGENQIQQKIENIAENTDEELDYSELIEGLEELMKNPINLNNTNESELKRLIFLNDFQIRNLLDYAKYQKKFISVYELQAIDGFNREIIYKILPYITISEPKKMQKIKLKNVLKYGRSDLFIRYQRVLEEQEGYSAIDDSTLNASPNSRYLGSPNKIYTRYNFRYRRNISLGVTAEKDAGEESFGGTQKNGFDYYSAHLFLQDFGTLKALAIGDYHLQFGQGLTLWTGLAFGKSSDAVNIKKRSSGVRRYSSVDENNFMRGIATTVGIKNFEITAFYSLKKVDANISGTDSVNSEEYFIYSLQETGYHSTPSQIEDKDAIKENIYGTHIAYNKKGLNVGVTAYKTKYDSELKAPSQLYNKFDFYGDENTNFGFDYSYSAKNFNIFGEVARSENGGLAYLNGLLISLDSRVSFSLLHRNYQRNYQSHYSSAFSESSENVNEKGLYIGMLASLSSKLSLSAYIDNFKFPWLKFRTDAPSGGVEYLVQLDYDLSRNVNMYFKFRQENKKINNSGDLNVIDFLDERIKQSYRYHISYRVSPSIVLKNRIEYSRYLVGSEESDNGYLFYQDLAYRPSRRPFIFTLRYAMFDTDSYDSRIYAYENDVLYAFSIPSYYYKGSRIYLLLRYKITKNIDFWLRYSQTYYSNKYVISSGLTQINGNTKSEVKAQFRIKI